MKVTVISTKKKIVDYKTVKLIVGKFTVTEEYENGVMIDQKWSIKGGFKTTHPTAYEPDRLRFSYYEDLSFLDYQKPINVADCDVFETKPSFITNWNNFKGLSHVFCFWLSMDGYIYNINKKTPMPMWRYQDYIGGLTSKYYRNLPELLEEISKADYIKNAKIIKIPYYSGGGEAIGFEYKTSKKLMSYSTNAALNKFEKIIKKYRKPSRDI